MIKLSYVSLSPTTSLRTNIEGNDDEVATIVLSSLLKSLEEVAHDSIMNTRLMYALVAWVYDE